MTEDLHVRGCTGKSAFDSMVEAEKRAKWMRRKYHEPLTAYRCTHCHKFHIGGIE